MRTISIQSSGFLGEPFTIVHDSNGQFMRVENQGNDVWLVQSKLVTERKPSVVLSRTDEMHIWASIGFHMGLTRILS